MEFKGISIYYLALGAYFVYRVWKGLKQKPAADTSTPPPPQPADDLEKQIREIFKAPEKPVKKPQAQQQPKPHSQRKPKSPTPTFSTMSPLESFSEEGEHAFAPIESVQELETEPIRTITIDAREAIIASEILGKPVGLRS